MKRKIPTLFLIFLSTLIGYQKAFSQITLSPTDTTLCPGNTYTIYASFASSNTPNNTDDYFSTTTTPIGFNFIYYGDTVNTCVVSANNFISFDLTKKGQYSNWVYSSAVTAGDVDDAIMFPFQDIIFAYGGTISYQTFGSAPHRIFVVEFCEVPMFSCTNQLVTNELVLYEGTNKIVMNIKNQPTCSWNGGTQIEGLRHNGSQNLVPGRDVPNTPWTAYNDSRMFTPNGTTSYTIDTIPFNYIPIIQNADSNQVVWYEEGNANPIGTGAHITVTVDPNIHYYVAKINGQACNDTGNVTYSDTSWVHFGTTYDTLDVNICQGETYNFFGRTLDYTGTFDTTITPANGGCDSFIHLMLHVNPWPIMTLSDTMANQYFCNGSEGILSIAQPSPNYATYRWERDGATIPGAVNPSLHTDLPGDYRLFITTNKQCTDSSKIVHLSKDTVNISFNIVPHLGCSNDTVQIVNNSEPGSSYRWKFGDGSYPPDTTRNPSHVYAQQGTYQVQLIMKDTLGCQDSLMKFVNTSHPFNAAFTVNKDSLCQGDATTVQFTNQSIGAVGYQWNFGDGTPGSTTTSPSHQYHLAGTHPARLIAFDSLGCQDTAFHNIYVDSLPFLKIISDKNDFCTGEKVYLHLDYLATTATKVNWSFGDGVDWSGTGAETHDYDRSGNYQIIVTAYYPVCGSVSDTLNIAIHSLPIVYLGPDTTLCLQGDPIILKNLATNNVPITKYKWSTGDTTSSLTVVHPGIYSLTAYDDDCYTTESVNVQKDCYTDIPNAFTPNGDGINDYFFPRQYLTNGVSSFTLSIYNRWGEKVFETSNTNGRGWDGKFNGVAQPDGVYIYQINLTYKNGRSDKYSGNITLIR